MKKIWICFMSIVLITGCSAAKEKAYQIIHPEDAYRMIQDGNVTIVDVRTKDEFDTGHITNAKNVPVESIEDVDSIVSDKETKILVYCRSGKRSAKASSSLAKMGYTNIYDIGGIQDWPYEIEK